MGSDLSGPCPLTLQAADSVLLAAPWGCCHTVGVHIAVKLVAAGIGTVPLDFPPMQSAMLVCCLHAQPDRGQVLQAAIAA